MELAGLHRAGIKSSPAAWQGLLLALGPGHVFVAAAAASAASSGMFASLPHHGRLAQPACGLAERHLLGWGRGRTCRTRLQPQCGAWVSTLLWPPRWLGRTARCRRLRGLHNQQKHKATSLGHCLGGERCCSRCFANCSCCIVWRTSRREGLLSARSMDIAAYPCMGRGMGRDRRGRAVLGGRLPHDLPHQPGACGRSK